MMRNSNKEVNGTKKLEELRKKKQQNMGTMYEIAQSLISQSMGKGYIKGSRPMLTVDHIGKAV